MGPSSNRHHHKAESGVQRGVVGTVFPREITGESWQTGQTVPKQPNITKPLLLLLVEKEESYCEKSFDVKCVKIKEDYITRQQ